MRNFSMILLGAAFVGAWALPAAADVHQLGSVNVAADHYTDVSWSRFEGPVYRLRFVAEGDTVDCDHIAVTYYDSTVHNVFSGTLVKDSTKTITFPEGDSRIRFVDFACKAQSVDGARIALSAASEGDDRATREDDYEHDAHVRTIEAPPPAAR